MKKVTLNCTYTNTPNHFFDLMPQLSGSAWKFLSFLIRETLGWHCYEKQLSLRYLERKTGLKRPTLLKARLELQAIGALDFVKRDTDVSTLYRLTLPDQESLPELDEPAAPQKRGGVKKHDPPGLKNMRSNNLTPLNKEILVNKDQRKQHHAAPDKSTPEPSQERQDSLGKNDDASSDLLIELKRIGMNPRVAKKTVRKYSFDLIRKVLDRLCHRKVSNAPGWVIAELRSGGYNAPKSLEIKEKHRLLERRRQEEKARDLEERRQRDLNQRADLISAAAQLTREEKEDLAFEAQIRARRLFGDTPATTELDSPLVKAQFWNLILERSALKTSGPGAAWAEQRVS